MQLTSNVFTNGNPIPPRHSCDSTNVSPALSWANVPPQTASFVIIADDPDAPGGTWVHWVLYDLPPATMSLPEAMPKTQYVPQGGTHGLNDFGHLGYGGPCPPRGGPHRYFFKLYALDRTLGLPPGATKAQIEKAMAGHILGTAELLGMYARR